MYLSLLEQDTTRKGWVDEKIAEQLEFKASGNNEEYNVEIIHDSTVYAKESELDHLLGLYYPIFQKSYFDDESTQKPISTVQYTWKLVSIYYKNHLNKPTATFQLKDQALLMAKHIALLNVNRKWKHGQPFGSIQKKAKYQFTTYQSAIEHRIGFFLVFLFSVNWSFRVFH